MKLTFEDALQIARGCTDYGGGYRSNAEHFEIYQHGIQTVINALTSASETGLKDTQTRALRSMGANAEVTGDALAHAEEMRTALDALEEIHPGNMTPMAEGNWNKAIAAIREAIQERNDK